MKHESRKIQTVDGSPPPDRKASDPQLFMDRLNNNKFSEIMSIFSGLVLHARLIFLIKIFAKLRPASVLLKTVEFFGLRQLWTPLLLGYTTKSC